MMLTMIGLGYCLQRGIMLVAILPFVLSITSLLLVPLDHV